MRLIKKLTYCLVAALPAAALVGCSSGGGSGSNGGGTPTGPAPEVSSITIDVVPTADAAGIYIAQDRGFFKQQGLNVTLKTALGGELAMPDLQSGKVQLIEGNYVSFVQAQIAGTFGIPGVAPVRPINMRIIANSSQMQPGNQALYVMPGSPYKTVRQLAKAHAVVGVNTLRNIGAVFLGSLLSANGYNLGSVTQKQEPLPFMPKYLNQHVIPAAWLPEPFGTQAQQEYGAVPIADFDQGSLQNFPIGCVIGDTKWIQQHPKTVAAFLRAYKQGQQVADSDRNAVEQALVAHIPHLDARTAATMTLDTYPLVMDLPVMQRVPDAMFQFGIIGKRFNISSMIQPQQDEITH